MNYDGFTLLELIMVILLVAIVSAVAIPRFAGVGDFALDNAAAKIASDIRYTQNRSTTTQLRGRVNFLSGTTYQIYYCTSYDSTPGTCSCASWIPVNTQVNISDDFSGVSISGVVGNCLEFDALGRPYYASCGAATSCNSSAGAPIALQYGGDSKNISVLTETGMVSY